MNLDLKGPVFSYESRRKNAMAFSDLVLASLDTLKSIPHMRELIIAGTWYNQLAFTENRLEEGKSKTNIQLRNYINQDSLLYFIGKGYNVYYLPRQDLNNLLKERVDITLFGAEPYIKKVKSEE